MSKKFLSIITIVMLLVIMSMTLVACSSAPKDIESAIPKVKKAGFECAEMSVNQLSIYYDADKSVSALASLCASEEEKNSLLEKSNAQLDAAINLLETPAMAVEDKIDEVGKKIKAEKDKEVKKRLIVERDELKEEYSVLNEKIVEYKKWNKVVVKGNWVVVGHPDAIRALL